MLTFFLDENIAGKIVSDILRTAQNIVHSQKQILRFARRTEPPWLVNLALPNEKDFLLGKPGALGKNKLLR